MTLNVSINLKLGMLSHTAWYIGYSLNMYWINKRVAHFYPFFEILPGSQLSLSKSFLTAPSQAHLPDLGRVSALGVPWYPGPISLGCITQSTSVSLASNRF